MPFVLLQSLILLVPSTCWSRCSLQEFQSCPFAVKSPPREGCHGVLLSHSQSTGTGSNQWFIQVAVTFGVYFLWFDRSPLLCSSLETGNLCPWWGLGMCFQWLSGFETGSCCSLQSLKQWSVQAVSAELEWLYLFVFSPNSYLYEISWSHIVCEVVKCYPASIRCDFPPPLLSSLFDQIK